MRRLIFGFCILTIVGLASALIFARLQLVFSDVPGVAGYRVYVRQGPTPWAQVTPRDLGAQPMPGNHTVVVDLPLNPGTVECAVTAYNAAGSESVLSNVVAGDIPTETPTATASATVTTTATATSIPPTRTAVPAPTLFRCVDLDITHDGTVSSLDAAIVLQTAVGNRKCL